MVSYIIFKIFFLNKNLNIKFLFKKKEKNKIIYETIALKCVSNPLSQMLTITRMEGVVSTTYFYLNNII